MFAGASRYLFATLVAIVFAIVETEKKQAWKSWETGLGMCADRLFLHYTLDIDPCKFLDQGRCVISAVPFAERKKFRPVFLKRFGHLYGIYMNGWTDELASLCGRGL